MLAIVSTHPTWYLVRRSRTCCLRLGTVARASTMVQAACLAACVAGVKSTWQTQERKWGWLRGHPVFLGPQHEMTSTHPEFWKCVQAKGRATAPVNVSPWLYAMLWFAHLREQGGMSESREQFCCDLSLLVKGSDQQ